MQILRAYHLHMRTTLNIDDQALTDAMSQAPGKTKTDVINEALREFARRRKLQDFFKFEGKLHWEGNLDDLRKREISRA
jgi:hypothetical protein